MHTVFKKCFLSSRFTGLFTKLIVRSILIPLLIENLIRFSVKMTPFPKRLYMWETEDIFPNHQPVQSVYLSLPLGMAAKWSDLHLSSQTVVQAPTFKIPGDSAANQLENGKSPVMWDFLLLVKHCRRDTPFISIYFHLFLYISQFFWATLDVLKNGLMCS